MRKHLAFLVIATVAAAAFVVVESDRAGAAAADDENERSESTDLAGAHVENQWLNPRADIAASTPYIRLWNECGIGRREAVHPVAAGPDKATCLILSQFGDKVTRGTGFIVAKRLILTAGHNVFRHRVGGPGEWASKITVIPGGEGAGLGRYAAVRVHTVAGWKNAGHAPYDYGAIEVATNDMSTAVGFQFTLGASNDPALKQGDYRLLGYPRDRGFALHRSIPDPGKKMHLRDVKALHMTYMLDAASGVSGGPVYGIARPDVVEGVHVVPGCPNAATRITPFRKERILTEWNPDRR